MSKNQQGPTHLETGELAGETVFVIGGGPSLNEQRKYFETIERFPVIVTNNAYQLFPSAFVLHWADYRWWTWHKDKLHLHRGKYKTTAARVYPWIKIGNLDRARMPPDEWRRERGPAMEQFWRDEGAIYLRRLPATNYGGLSNLPGTVCGRNAGHQAINIAWSLGAKCIVLLGFDFTTDAAGNTHWHQDHLTASNQERWRNVMLPEFETVSQALDESNTEIYNVNKNSAIKCFPIKDIEEFI